MGRPDGADEHQGVRQDALGCRAQPAALRLGERRAGQLGGLHGPVLRRPHAREPQQRLGPTLPGRQLRDQRAEFGVRAVHVLGPVAVLADLNPTVREHRLLVRRSQHRGPCHQTSGGVRSTAGKRAAGRLLQRPGDDLIRAGSGRAEVHGPRVGVGDQPGEPAVHPAPLRDGEPGGDRGSQQRVGEPHGRAVEQQESLRLGLVQADVPVVAERGRQQCEGRPTRDGHHGQHLLRGWRQCGDARGGDP